MNGKVQAVRGVDLDVGRGEMVGIVGESGSGKSVTFLGLMGLLPKSAMITGSAKVNGEELVGLTSKQLMKVRGKKIAMIFQDPLSALNPVHEDRCADRRDDPVAPGHLEDRGRTRGPWSCSTSSASRSQRSGRCSIRTSSPAACASA